LDAKDKGNLADLLITCRKLHGPVLTRSVQSLMLHAIFNPAQSSFLSRGSVYCQQGQSVLPQEEMSEARLQGCKFPLQEKPRLHYSA